MYYEGAQTCIVRARQKVPVTLPFSNNRRRKSGFLPHKFIQQWTCGFSRGQPTAKADPRVASHS
jgi:hypothetical protein